MPAPHHSVFFTDLMLFLMLNQQCQSTEGIQNEVYLFANAVLCKYTDHFRAVESIVMYGD